jgi:methionyl-tRNA synthetase
VRAMSERILVTAALPYANGSIHIGHLVEYIMTDVYVRALRLAGEDAIYICADDTHGTPIELNAQKAGVAPEVFVAKYGEEHVVDFKAFHIRFDSYYSTNSIENRVWCYEIYDKLKKGGHIRKKSLEMFYDEKAARFLPDRFVRGTCPKCGAADQYGDVCEVCNSTYEPTDLKDPYSVVTKTRPVMKSSQHLFVDLNAFQSFLVEWTSTPGRLQPEIKAFLDAWLSSDLKDWCISRDAPYFGFPIPDEPEKFFYVWLDAPIGYISSTENFARSINQPQLVNDIWRNGKARIEHVIGKDIIYFHTLFWPAMLKAADLTPPSKVHVHGMLTVDGVKMSKTRGTFINAATFRKHIDPNYLRYYFASKIGPRVEDIDLSIDEFVNRVNAELVNNIANLVARGVPFIKDKLGGRYGRLRPEAQQHVDHVKQRVSDAEAHYRAFDLASAVKVAIELATLGNKLFQDGQPWKLARENEEAARDLVTLCLNIARAATVLISPVVPAIAEKIYPMLGLQGAPASFREGTAFDLTDRPIGVPDRVIERVEKKAFEAVIAESKEPEPVKAPPPVKPSSPSSSDDDDEIEKTVKLSALKTAPAAPPASAATAEVRPKEINIDKFLEVDLRVGLILKAEYVEGADALLRLTVEMGEARPRNIFAGIRAAYDPKTIEGKKVAVVANLAPRKMRFGVSEGMVLAGGPGGKDIWLLTLSDEAVPGARIR